MSIIQCGGVVKLILEFHVFRILCVKGCGVATLVKGVDVSVVRRDVRVNMCIAGL